MTRVLLTKSRMYDPVPPSPIMPILSPDSLSFSRVIPARLEVLPSSTVTQAARSSFRPGALGARLGTTHAIASMRTDKDSG